MMWTRAPCAASSSVQWISLRARHPSTADFLQYEIPRILERLATDLDGSTVAIAGADDVRVMITSGLLVAQIATYLVVRADGSADLIGLEIER